MRVLRVGGRFLAVKERRLWVGLGFFVLVVGVALGALFAALPVALPVLPVVVLAALVIVIGGGWFARHLHRIRQGRLGERLVTNLLGQLSADYWLINDLVAAPRRGNVDHVVVGPCGVVIIETKRVAGHIRCDGDDWYVNGHRRRSMSRQVNAGAVAVKELLARRHPDFTSFVTSIVVLTHPLCRVEVNRARTTVVRYSELKQVILDLARRRRLSPARAAELAHTLGASHELTVSVQP